MSNFQEEKKLDGSSGEPWRMQHKLSVRCNRTYMTPEYKSKVYLHFVTERLETGSESSLPSVKKALSSMQRRRIFLSADLMSLITANGS